MLPKKSRLKKKEDIEHLFLKGQSIKTKLFICKFHTNKVGFLRPAFAVSAKFKFSVPQKNRLKRQMVHAYKKVIENTKEAKAFDIIFILSNLPSVTTKRFDTFKSEIENILNKLN